MVDCASQPAGSNHRSCADWLLCSRLPLTEYSSPAASPAHACERRDRLGALTTIIPEARASAQVLAGWLGVLAIIEVAEGGVSSNLAVAWAAWGCFAAISFVYIAKLIWEDPRVRQGNLWTYGARKRTGACSRLDALRALPSLRFSLIDAAYAVLHNDDIRCLSSP